MTTSNHQSASPDARPRTVRVTPPLHRWECGCQQPPVLLATWTDTGQVNIKVRDRYWHAYGFGVIQTVCPRCATEHRLDLDTMTGSLPGLDGD